MIGCRVCDFHIQQWQICCHICHCQNYGFNVESISLLPASSPADGTSPLPV